MMASILAYRRRSARLHRGRQPACGRDAARRRAATTRRGKVVAGIALWMVAAGSKFVVLELVALVFGDAVSLGGFLPVSLLVLALLASRAGVRRLLAEAAAR